MRLFSWLLFALGFGGVFLYALGMMARAFRRDVLRPWYRRHEKRHRRNP